MELEFFQNENVIGTVENAQVRLVCNCNSW